MQFNFNFMHCLGLTDVLSANKHAEMFAGMLLCGIRITFRVASLFLSHLYFV